MEATREKLITAIRLLDALEETSCQKPEIALDEDGDVCLDWYIAKGKVFSIAVGEDSKTNYAGLNGGERVSGSFILDKEIPSIITKWLAAIGANIANNI